MAKGRKRPPVERAEAVALAQVCDNNNEAARLLEAAIRTA